MTDCYRCGGRLLRDWLGEHWCVCCGTVAERLSSARDLELRADRSAHKRAEASIEMVGRRRERTSEGEESR